MKKHACLLFLVTLLAGPTWSATASAAQQYSKDYKKAEKLYTARKYGEAIELYQNVLAAAPDDVPPADLHLKIADSHFQLGDFNKALASYRNALREQERSERPMTQYWIGFCCFLTGRDNEAVKELLKIPELYPESGMLVSTAYYWAARASERMGNRDQAVDFYRKAGGTGKSTQARFAKKKAEAVKGSSTK